MSKSSRPTLPSAGTLRALACLGIAACSLSGCVTEYASNDGVAFIVAQIPSLHWSGNVILIKGTQVYINRGTREGVANGQTFKVGTSEVLRDPATGETLDVAFTEKGRIKVDNAKEKIAICSVVSGDGMENGMAVAPLTP